MAKTNLTSHTPIPLQVHLEERVMRAMYITPQIAAEWVNKNGSNRPLRPGRVEQYAADMANNRWTRCDEPIQFYENGDIANGQHRLFAIIESGISQWFFVSYGLKKEDGINIDTGAARNPVDAARIAGDADFSKTLVSAAKGIALGSENMRRRTSLSTLATIEVVAKYREAAEWATSNVRKTRALCGSTVLGAVGRAYLAGVDKQKLARFCDVLATGFYDSESESAAIAIRNYLQARGSASKYEERWYDTFLKIQNAIKYFIAGKKLTHIKGVAEEVYPLVTAVKAAKPADAKPAAVKKVRA